MRQPLRLKLTPSNHSNNNAAIIYNAAMIYIAAIISNQEH